MLSQLSHYQDRHRLQQDVNELLASHRANLKPQVQRFGHAVLCMLSGTVPINYRGAQYNIPVTLYLDPPYPSTPPRAFVTPTESMGIKDKHPAVGDRGMIWLPYLNQWRPLDRGNSNLVGVVTCIIGEFSKNPPVYAKSSTPQAQVQPQAAQPVVVQAQLVNASPASAAAHQRVPVAKAVAAQLTHEQKLQLSVKAKVDAALVKLTDEHQRQMNIAAKENEEVTSHNKAVERGLAELRQDTDKIRRAMDELEDLEQDARTVMAKHQGPFDIHTAVAPNGRLAAQLLDNIATDCALDDYREYIAELIKDPTISEASVAQYTKEIRDTCRQQFLTRALRKKILRAIQASSLTSA